MVRLECTRNYLQPGDVVLALDRWRHYVRDPRGQLWEDCGWGGDVHWYCCASPLEGRALLDRVMLAMSPRSARELRAVISTYEALGTVPFPELGGRR